MQQFIFLAMRNDLPSEYEPADYPPFAVTADIVLFSIDRDAKELQVLLVKRGEDPFKGAWALPGGFVRPDEDLREAATREVSEETGIVERDWALEQFGAYGAPDRDPRMRVVTVAYCGVVSELPDPVGGGDAAAAAMKPVAGLESEDVELAFDHRRIVADALEWMRSRLEYTALATAFCGATFTIAEIRGVYEVVWGVRLDPGNFQRNFRRNACFRRAMQPVEKKGVRGRRPSIWSLCRNPADRAAEVLLDRRLASRSQARSGTGGATVQ